MSRLTGQTVVVIGGSSGIGFSVAEQAIASGADVIIGSSNASKVENAVMRLGSAARGAVIDVSDEGNVAQFFSSLGSFDHLAVTSGSPHSAPPSHFSAIDLESARKRTTVKFWGSVACLKHAAASMRQHGSVTLTGGVLAHRPAKGSSLMSAFNGALEHLVHALAIELAPLRVNLVCPGFVSTPLTAGIPPDVMNRAVEHQPLRRSGRPEELAGSYIHLMDATFTTGQTLIVDGGRSL